MLELRLLHGAGDHLLEAPMATDQTSSREHDALFVRGTVLLSQRLPWWLRAFGPNVEVIGPAPLRIELADEAQRLARLYSR